MSRYISEDFVVLKSFIQEYKVSDLLVNNDFVIFISQVHKKYFAYLTYIAELNNCIGNTELLKSLSEKQYLYLQESCSDCGLAFFNSFHGGYKASKLLLRSSIENFMKGFIVDELTDIDKEKSVYELFRKVKMLDFFSTNSLNLALFNKIHDQYKSLCMDVHTASVLNMASVSALDFFPSFQKEQAASIVKSVLVLIPCYITLLAIKYNDHFHSIHYKNKEIILQCISKKNRPKVFNLEE